MSIKLLLRRTLHRPVTILNNVRQSDQSLSKGLGSSFCNTIEQLIIVLSIPKLKNQVKPISKIVRKYTQNSSAIANKFSRK